MLRRVALHTLWISIALERLLPSAADPDLWGHLLFGRLLLGGHLPDRNGFAYTAASHPWVNHEILAELTMAAIFNALGAAGLVAMKAAIGLGTFFIVWRTACTRSRSAVASAVATATAAVVMAPGLMIRPQLFTLLFLAITLALLQRESFRARRTAWVLPPLVVLWVNTHGGVLAGVGLAAIGVTAALAVRVRRGESSARDLLATSGFLAALGAALLVNPYGPALVRFLVSDVTPSVPITEWAPVTLGDLSSPALKAVLLIVGAGLLWTRAASLPEALIVAAAALAALLHRRHVPLFAIAAAPLLATVLARTWAFASRRLEAGVRTRVRRDGLVALAAVQLALAITAGLRAGGRIVVDPRYYPVQAVRFLSENAISGNVALPFRWGEYALWSLPAGTRVAVDGRFTTAYPAPLLEDAWRFMTGGPGWEALLTRYPTDIVIADQRQATARLLRADPEWEYVYADRVSIVFLRHVPSQIETLERFHAGDLQYDQAPLEIDFPAATAHPPSAIPSAPVAPTAACRIAAFVARTPASHLLR